MFCSQSLIPLPTYVAMMWISNNIFTDYFLARFLYFPPCFDHIRDIMRCVLFAFRLRHQHYVGESFHVSYSCCSFSFVNSVNIHLLLISHTDDGIQVFLFFLAILNNLSTNVLGHVFGDQIYVYLNSMYTRCGIARPYDMLTFIFIRR